MTIYLRFLIPVKTAVKVTQRRLPASCRTVCLAMARLAVIEQRMLGNEMA